MRRSLCEKQEMDHTREKKKRVNLSRKVCVKKNVARTTSAKPRKVEDARRMMKSVSGDFFRVRASLLRLLRARAKND